MNVINVTRRLSAAVAAVVLAAALGGCTPQPVAPPAPDVSLLRNPTAPLASQADVNAADLSGDWVVRQRVDGTWPFGSDTVQFAAQGDALVLRVNAAICTGADQCEAAPRDIPYPAGIAGRFGGPPDQAIPGAIAPPELWVHWMDFDRRTVALGSPNSDFVVILDRRATGGGDRITAARDILDWYGYDMDALRPISR